MSDIELRLKCVELAIECASWLKGIRNGMRISSMMLADIMFQYIKHGKKYDGEPYWPLL